ncbi:RHS repeat protein, partial [Escherichia coli]|nr:RHS repeat protein [Escherichia coli]
YDRHGNLVAYTDGNGVVWTMEYGPFDLPVARTIQMCLVGLILTTFGYKTIRRQYERD